MRSKKKRGLALSILKTLSSELRAAKPQPVLPEMGLPPKASRHSKRVKRDSLPVYDATIFKPKQQDMNTGMFSNPFSVLQNTDDSILEEIATKFGVDLGYDNVSSANISLIKGKELAQETLQKAVEKRKMQKMSIVESDMQSGEEMDTLAHENDEPSSQNGGQGGTIDQAT